VIDFFDHAGIDAIGWDAAVAVKGKAGNAKMDVGGEDDLDEGIGGGKSGDWWGIGTGDDSDWWGIGGGARGDVDGLDAVCRERGSGGENGAPGKGWKKEQAAITGEDGDHAIKITFMKMGGGYVLVNSS
jgi:hypothetical protein